MDKFKMLLNGMQYHVSLNRLEGFQALEYYRASFTF